MQSQSPESLVEERVAQLQAITQRRNELLRQMYQMMQRRQHYGIILAPEEEQEEEAEPEGLHVFLDQYDLQKHPRGAYFSDVPRSELFALPSLAAPSIPTSPEREGADRTGGEESQDSATTLPEISSSLSAPASSGSNPPNDEGSNAKSPSHSYDVSMDVDDGPDAAALTSLPSPLAHSREKVELDTVVRPPSQTLSPQHLALVNSHHQDRPDEEDDDDRDELDIIGSLSPSHSRSQSSAPPTRTSTLEPQFQHKPPISLPSDVNVPSPISPPPEPNNIDDEQSDVDMALSDPEDDDMQVPVATALNSDSGANPRPMLPGTDPAVEGPITMRSVTPPQSLAPISVDLPSRHSPKFIALPPSAIAGLPAFNFDPEPKGEQEISPVSQRLVPPKQARGHFNKSYKLPPLKTLPVEFHRKTKALKQQRKKEREREKNGKSTDKDSKGEVKDEWTPMGINKWGATVRANPVYKKVGRATKCLSTRDWNVSWTELRLIRTLERVESMKDAGRWSFRQPKKQRGTGGLTKTHWDFLLDEMRWMRTDFREERKWKMALAYNLSTAVLEWHAAGSLRERLIRGICVLWKRPRTEITTAEDSGNEAGSDQMDVDDNADEPAANPMVDYNSSDNDDDEADGEQKDVIDSLDTSAIVHAALDDAEAAALAPGEESAKSTEILRPKLEEREDVSALRAEDGMDIDNLDLAEHDAKVEADGADGISKTEEDAGPAIPAGLKPTSTDPVLGAVNTDLSLSKPSAKSNLYAPMRERVAYASVDKLFLDLDDYEDLVKDLGALSTGNSFIEPPPPPPDLSAIFPDLTPFGLLNIPSQTAAEGKKKSDKNKDDPNKRTEDTTYSRLMPIGEFMYCKPTLIGPLNPAKNWIEDDWSIQDETSNVVDSEVPVVGDALCDLFGGTKPSMATDRSFPLREPADARRRVAEQIWTSSDDVLLKTLVERYPNNWPLIADAFNSSRVTVSTDLRLPWDCYERYNTRWSGHSTTFKDNSMNSPSVADASPRDQMTTRGVKRLASVSAGVIPSPGGYANEPKKRRRHLLMSETIRKATKKRDASQKLNAAQKKSSAVHDTHGQYAKMPRYTPEQLSRMKSDKDQKDQDNIKLVMQQRQQQEMQRQQILQQNGRAPVGQHPAMMQQQPQSQLPQQGQPPQQLQQPPQQQQQQHTQQMVQSQQPQQQSPVQSMGNARPTGAGAPVAQGGVSQIRNQVNISQQQRMPTPMAGVANARLSPQQMLHAQAQVVQQAAQARAMQVAAAQAHAQAHAAQNAANGINMNNSHLSPPYNSRATTSSPMPHSSPPHQSSSPHLPSAQAQVNMGPTVPGNAMPRQNMNHYFPVPNMQMQQNMPANNYTQEQMEHALRLQSLVQARSQPGMPQGQGGSYPAQS